MMSLTTFTFVIIAHYKELHQITNALSLKKRMSAYFTVELEQENQDGRSKQLERAPTLKIHGANFGVATEVSHTLLSMNLEEVLTLVICSAGSIVIQSEWSSREALLLLKLREYGLRPTSTQGSGIQN